MDCTGKHLTEKNHSEAPRYLSHEPHSNRDILSYKKGKVRRQGHEFKQHLEECRKPVQRFNDRHCMINDEAVNDLVEEYLMGINSLNYCTRSTFLFRLNKTQYFVFRSGRWCLHKMEFQLSPLLQFYYLAVTDFSFIHFPTTLQTLIFYGTFP